MSMSWRTVPLLVEHFGPTRAKELLLTGQSIDADKALSWGLANRTASGNVEELHAMTREWAQEIAEGVPAVAASMIKETVNAVANFRTPLAHMDTEQFIVSQGTEDHAESITAFLQKRKPSFTGR
jgi:enoyl-CoA hydratase/carnithine racemase